MQTLKRSLTRVIVTVRASIIGGPQLLSVIPAPTYRIGDYYPAFYISGGGKTKMVFERRLLSEQIGKKPVRFWYDDPYLDDDPMSHVRMHEEQAARLTAYFERRNDGDSTWASRDKSK